MDPVTDYRKPAWWNANLRWLLHNDRRRLRDANGKFAYHYLEMVGYSGHHMFDLMRPYLLTPKHFMGVDNDTGALMTHVLEKRQFDIVFGDVFKVALTTAYEGKNGRVLGVLNLDTMHGMRVEWWMSHRTQLRGIVEAATAKCPLFSVIFNHVLDRGVDAGVSLEQRLVAQAEGLSQTFSGWSGLRMREDLLKDASPAWTDKGFVGRAGVFDIYRSEDRPTRMATIRLSFDRQRKAVNIDRSITHGQ